MFNEDRTVAVAFNGEIYNFKRLREELLPRHAFVSTSDTEVLVHGYEEWGSGFVDRLEGMFALAMVDLRRRSVLLARDSVGIKPLYYVETPEWIAFASEARALLKLDLPGAPGEVDMDSARRLLMGMYLADPDRTLLKGVRKLPAGHTAGIENGKMEVRRFWRLGRSEDIESIAAGEAVDRTRVRLQEIVRDHLVADVEVGVLLSGGLDSSLLAAMAQRCSDKPIATFTAGFPHVWDERPYAREVAAHIGSRHQEILIDPQAAVKRLANMIDTYDDLGTVDGGILMIHAVTEQIRERGIKVLLVGEGADEVFGGYSWYGVSQQPFRSLPLPARALLCYYASSRMLLAPWRGARNVANVFRESGQSEPFRQIQYWEITSQLPNHYIMKVDKATMAHGVEARVPYLDRRLVQWAYDLPRRVLLPRTWWSLDPEQPKWLLRQVAAPLLPASIRGRRKRGFSLPMHDVIQANIDLVKDCLMGPQSIAAAFFSERERARLLRYRYSSYHPVQKHREWLIWKLFLMELWRRKVVAGR